jgi:hypothetical protein
MLDSAESVYASQAWSEYLATSVLFSRLIQIRSGHSPEPYPP